jgi:hypothetical protein
MIAKALHILVAWLVAVALYGLFHLLGWNWLPGWPLGILTGIYTVSILFSPASNPVPFSRTANDRLDAYYAHCLLKGKEPSQKEYAVTDCRVWQSELPYPVDIMAAYFRMARIRAKGGPVMAVERKSPGVIEGRAEGINHCGRSVCSLATLSMIPKKMRSG